MLLDAIFDHVSVRMIIFCLRRFKLEQILELLAGFQKNNPPDRLTLCIVKASNVIRLSYTVQVKKGRDKFTSYCFHVFPW